MILFYASNGGGKVNHGLGLYSLYSQSAYSMVMLCTDNSLSLLKRQSPSFTVPFEKPVFYITMLCS